MAQQRAIPKGIEDALVIAAFEGWNDAADAATSTVDHLIRVWDADLVHNVDPEEYYDFQVNRPITETNEDGDRQITWMTTQVYLARAEQAGRNVVLIRGIEPNMHWRAFCAELLSLISDADPQLVVTLGALLADSPHTRPIPVSASSPDRTINEAFELEPATYNGPTGIVGVFADSCKVVDAPSVSVWAAIPHYAQNAPCPKATLALVNKLEELLDLTIPVNDLPELAQAWQRGVDRLSADDPEVGEYVQSLEESRDATDLPEASGEAIAAEFERWLRRRGKPGRPGQ